MIDSSYLFEHNTELPAVEPDKINHEYILGNHDLPIAAYRQDFEASIQKNAITLAEGDTGSGKSTQIPQYIFELEHKGLLNVSQSILTQPRVVATMSLASRIFYEMQQAGIDNPMVGHYTQPYSSPIPQHEQAIPVLTVGKATAQLVHMQTPNDGYTILQIDEVHEMDKDIEFALAIAKQKTDQNSKFYDENFKAVIMSATIDSTLIKDYFAHTTVGHIKVDVSPYPVNKEETTESVAKAALRLVQKEKTVLAFLAGKGEIETTKEKILGIQAFQDESDRAAVVTLHAQQNAEQQAEAFKHYENGVIVLATNVAETSLTLPNVVAVVDSGEMREAAVSYTYIPTGHDTLNVRYAALSNVKQRAGRAGRTEPGTSVRVSQTGGMPKKLTELDAYATPSILRESLDDILLRVKATGKELTDYEFLHQPNMQAIEAAQQKLVLLGALSKDGLITKRGLRMEKLPLDPEFACMIAYAEEQGYSDQVKQNVLDIVAMMQRGGVFERSPKKQRWLQLLATNNQGEVAEQQSDFIAQLEAFSALINDIPQKHWQDFDANMYALEIITSRREKLAKDAGLNVLLPVSAVKNEDREAVLSCIYAGQLPQVWRRNGSIWQFAYNPKVEFDLHPTSIVSELGKIATGSLFSIGTHGVFTHSIQDVNLVEDIRILDKVADHIITETLVPNSRKFDAEKGIFTDDYQRKLGVISLRTISREVTTESENNAEEKLAKDYSELIWKQHNSTTPVLEAYMPEDLAYLKDNPEHSVIATNIYSGEPIYEWYGADRRPMRTEEDAKKSLQAQYDRLQKAPKEQIRREIKAELDILRSNLIQLSKNSDKNIAATAKQLRKSKVNTPEYLAQVKEFIAQNS